MNSAPKSSLFDEFRRFEAKIYSLIYAIHKLEEFQFIIQFQGYCRDNILSAPKLLLFAEFCFFEAKIHSLIYPLHKFEEFFVCGWLGESIQILQNINLSTTQPKSLTISWDMYYTVYPIKCQPFAKMTFAELCSVPLMCILPLLWME